MNLNEFELTIHNGLYISKDEHPNFGKKYIARFQYDKKRYVKVLGYSKRDNLTLNKAIELIENFKKSVIKDKGLVKPTTKVTTRAPKKTLNDKLKELRAENRYFKSLLGDYKQLDSQILNEGIQKIYDLQSLKPYQIELIKLQNWLEKENKRMIILFEGRDAAGKGGRKMKVNAPRWWLMGFSRKSRWQQGRRRRQAGYRGV